MPSKSRAQHNLMEMVAHDSEAAKRVGIPQSVAREYNQADKGKTLPDETQLQNIVDEIAQLIDATLYKLRQFA